MAPQSLFASSQKSGAPNYGSKMIGCRIYGTDNSTPFDRNYQIMSPSSTHCTRTVYFTTHTIHHILSIYLSIHTYIHRYIHTCMHAYMHTYIHIYIYVNIRIFRFPTTTSVVAHVKHRSRQILESAGLPRTSSTPTLLTKTVRALHKGNPRLQSDYTVPGTLAHTSHKTKKVSVSYCRYFW